MIFDERSFKLKVAHATDENLERRLVEAFTHRQFDVAECGEKLRKLTRLSVPEERFLAGDTADPRCEATGQKGPPAGSACTPPAPAGGVS